MLKVSFYRIISTGKKFQASIFAFNFIAVIFLILYGNVAIECSTQRQHRVVVAGASGYIGRAVVKELGLRGIPTASLVRSNPTYSEITRNYLSSSKVIECNVLDATSTDAAIESFSPTAVINCLASRTGLRQDTYEVDYRAGSNILQSISRTSPIGGKIPHYVLLSAFCCAKPRLQFQFAKLKLEDEIRMMNNSTSHSIVRATAFFKSLDGQIESVRKGNPVLYFGDGSCAANAISENDLAHFLVECAIQPSTFNMFDTTRNIGGPDVPPITKLQQIQLIYDTLQIPEEKRRKISIPLQIFDVLISFFTGMEYISKSTGLTEFEQKFNDATELARIVQYYASEPMVACSPEEVFGKVRLTDHFSKIAKNGGYLDEIDLMTTTTGVLNAFSKKDFSTDKSRSKV